MEPMDVAFEMRCTNAVMGYVYWRIMYIMLNRICL